jgi:hypothetical protein
MPQRLAAAGGLIARVARTCDHARLFTRGEPPMQPQPRHRRASLWLFAACVALYLGLVGPWLISAASTLAVAAGLILLVALLVWAWRLFGRPFN